MRPQLASPVNDHYQDRSEQSQKLEKSRDAGDSGQFVRKTPRLARIFWSWGLVGFGFLV